MHGTINISFHLKGSTVNSDDYCELLRHVKKDIKIKKMGHQSEVVMLHHENARSHTAGQTVQTIDELGWELVHHHPYIRELTPSYFHLFSYLKTYTSGNKFESDDQGECVVSDWLRHQSKDFFFRWGNTEACAVTGKVCNSAGKICWKIKIR